MFSLQMELLIVLVLGFWLGKYGFLDLHTRDKLTNIVIQFILPCSILKSLTRKHYYLIRDMVLWILHQF